jgi:hypothetical protein
MNFVKKTCPLSFSETFPPETAMELRSRDCVRERCAWWDTKEQECAVLVIARNLRKEVPRVGLDGSRPSHFPQVGEDEGGRE